MLYYLQIIKEQGLNTFQKYQTMLYTPKNTHLPAASKLWQQGICVH